MKFLRIGMAVFLASSAISYADDCNLIVGASDYAPLTYNDSGNNVIGLDVELLNIIGKQAGCKVTWQPILPWERVITEIKSGELLLTTSASNTPERLVFSKFIAYRPDSTKVFVRPEDISKLQGINSLADLITKTDFTIGIYTGYHYGSSFEKLYADPKYKSRFVDIPDNTMSANFMKLQAHRVDAVILETVVGMDLIKKGNLNNQIMVLGFELDDPGPESFANLMISKAADPTGKYFNMLQNAIAIVQDTDDYKQILKKYFTAE
jgi:polar amino acid transport system substrate-binding protein